MKTLSDVKSGELAGEVVFPPNALGLSRKWGANHGEAADHPRRHHANCKPSEDSRKDLGIRQLKMNSKGKC